MTAGKAGLQRGSRMTVYPHMLSPHAHLFLSVILPPKFISFLTSFISLSLHIYSVSVLCLTRMFTIFYLGSMQ